MKLYCNPDDPEDKFLWDTKERLLKERGIKCEACGITEESYLKQAKEHNRKVYTEWIEKHKAEIEERRAKLLNTLFKRFQEEFLEIMNDRIVADMMMTWEERLEKNVMYEGIRFEVDHIIATSTMAIPNGNGSTWDFCNLQLLCMKCHQAKTKTDIFKRRELVRHVNKL